MSFVVEKKNIHEVQDFIRFADTELKVDRIYVRPLSQLGTEYGTVEDHRDLQPYESDVRDMLDSVRDYLTDRQVSARLFLNPENFRAVRPDPVETVLMPLGYENRLLAPRRNDWSTDPSVSVTWNLNTVELESNIPPRESCFSRSAPIPVEANRTLEFEAEGWSASGAVDIAVLDEDDQEIASITIPNSVTCEFRPIHLRIATEGRETVWLAVRHRGAPFHAHIDFKRLRTPALKPRKTPQLPAPDRWEVDTAEGDLTWNGGVLALNYTGPPGQYITKSYAVPCFPNTEIALPVTIDLAKGRLGVGVLNAEADSFINQFEVAETGVSETVLAFNTGNNTAFRIVLYAVDKPGANAVELEATIDWAEVIAKQYGFQEPSDLDDLVSNTAASIAPISRSNEGPDAPPLSWTALLRRKALSAKRVLRNPKQIIHVVNSKFRWLASAIGTQLLRLGAWIRNRIAQPLTNIFPKSAGTLRTLIATLKKSLSARRDSTARNPGPTSPTSPWTGEWMCAASRRAPARNATRSEI